MTPIAAFLTNVFTSLLQFPYQPRNTTLSRAFSCITNNVSHKNNLDAFWNSAPPSIGTNTSKPKRSRRKGAFKCQVSCQLRFSLL